MGFLKKIVRSTVRKAANSALESAKDKASWVLEEDEIENLSKKIVDKAPELSDKLLDKAQGLSGKLSSSLKGLGKNDRVRSDDESC